MADQKESKLYEVGFLIKAEEAAQSVLGLLKQHGAEIASEGALKKLTLAYPIKKTVAGFFGYIQFRLSPDSINALQHDMRMNPSVLRCIFVMATVLRPDDSRSGAPRMRRPRPAMSEQPKKPETLSNEAIEKKIEEILQ